MQRLDRWIRLFTWQGAICICPSFRQTSTAVSFPVISLPPTLSRGWRTLPTPATTPNPKFICPPTSTTTVHLPSRPSTLTASKTIPFPTQNIRLMPLHLRKIQTQSAMPLFQPIFVTARSLGRMVGINISSGPGNCNCTNTTGKAIATAQTARTASIAAVVPILATERAVGTVLIAWIVLIVVIVRDRRMLEDQRMHRLEKGLEGASFYLEYVLWVRTLKI